MYHCHVRFYLAGNPNRIFEIIKAMSPLESFTHEFLESEKLEGELAAKADVILADLRGQEAGEAVQTLIANKAGETELILLAEKEQMELLEASLPEVKDVWMVPMSEEETRFRFLRWQQTCKMSKDFWQTSHYLEATIDNVPNLIWYKDKHGIHEKVNNSFCQTVNKTKQQVEGRGHAYIWDVEFDDPVCIKSEQEVMSKERTFVSEESVKSGDGMKLLTTYKSPLYDLDGSVMGTVGVAIDVTQERAYEQEIMQKNHTLETIFTTMDCGVMRHSLDGSRIISINKAALDILGYSSEEELLNDDFQTVAHTVFEEDRTRLLESIGKLKNAGSPDVVSVIVNPTTL